MRISTTVLALAATLFSNAHLVIAKGASFSFTEEKVAEDGAKVLKNLRNGNVERLLSAPSQDRRTAAQDTPYRSLTDCENGFEVAVILKTDNKPQQTSWEIVDKQGNTMASKDDFSDEGTIYSDSICLPNQPLLNTPVCDDDYYTFIIKDSQGNGLGNGAYYRVIVEGERYDDGSRFTGSEVETDLPGCTDEEGPRCLMFSDSTSCKDTDGCFFYQGTCLYCAALSEVQCGAVDLCGWNGSSCE